MATGNTNIGGCCNVATGWEGYLANGGPKAPYMAKTDKERLATGFWNRIESNQATDCNRGDYGELRDAVWALVSRKRSPTPLRTDLTKVSIATLVYRTGSSE